MKGIKYFKGFIYGIVLGITTLIPGISGGTIAVFLNIYEKFFSVASFVNIKKNIPVLVLFCVGGACSLFTLSYVILYLLDTHGQIMYFCFIGMILGCIPMVYKQAKQDKFRRNNVFLFVIAFALMLVLTFASGGDLNNKNLEEFGGITPYLLGLLFFAGAVSAIAALIPGISGAVIMLILGTYEVSVKALATLNLTILCTLAAGMATGGLTSIKLIKYMLAHYHQMAYCAILGLIIGSVITIYPGFSIDAEGAFSIIFALIFALLVWRLTKNS